MKININVLNFLFGIAGTGLGVYWFGWWAIVPCFIAAIHITLVPTT